MMVICVLNEVCQDDKELTVQYDDELKWAVNEVLKHVQVCRYSGVLLTKRWGGGWG